MTVNDFAIWVCSLEVKNVNITQVKEILKISNTLLHGDFYKMIYKYDPFEGA